MTAENRSVAGIKDTETSNNATNFIIILLWMNPDSNIVSGFFSWKIHADFKNPREWVGQLMGISIDFLINQKEITQQVIKNIEIASLEYINGI